MTSRHLATTALLLVLVTLPALAQRSALPVLGSSPGGSAPTAGDDEDKPVLLTADEMINDQNLGVVTARGHVEIVQGDRVLLADVVSYNRQANIVTATGNVSILEPDGTVTFANHVELNDDMRDGFVEGVRVQMADNSRLAAVAGTRTAGITNQLEKAVYSPCDICKEKPERAPLWQIKAYKVVHDERTKDIEYKDAFFEVLGVPVFYTPYFSHPDPSVKRRSGFLTPSPGQSSRLGFVLKTPYYQVIDDYSDATFMPYYASNDGLIGVGEFRQRFSDGDLVVKGSASYMDPRDFQGQKTGNSQFRGHIDAHGLWDIGNDRHWGFDIQSTSDDTFLRRFKILRGDMLTTRLFAEAYDDRNFMDINSYAFQGLTNQDSPGATPYILPQVSNSWYSEPDRFGGRFRLDNDFLALGRSELDDTVRTGIDGQYRLPWTGPLGDLYSMTVGFRGNFYYVNDLRQADGSDEYTGFVGRAMPYVAADWSYPFVSDMEQIRQVIAPTIAVSATTTGNNGSVFPNNDSRTFEFDHSSLFKTVRFPGWDRVDDGVRATYGVKYSIYGSGQGYSEFFIGQSYRFSNDLIYPLGSGADTKLSDYVSNITLSPAYWMQLSQRMRLDNSDGAIKRHELQLSFGPENIRVTGAYAFLQNDGSGAIAGNREQASIAGEWIINDNWSVSGSTARDLDGSQPLYYETKLTYGNECIGLDFLVQRTYARDRDIEPSTDIGVVLRLRNLG